MIRKILGGVLILEAALIIIGSIVNGSFMSDQGSAAATYGTFVGTMLPVIVNVFGGIFITKFFGSHLSYDNRQAGRDFQRASSGVGNKRFLRT